MRQLADTRRHGENRERNGPMKMSVWKTTAVVTVALTAVLTTSCMRPPAPAPAAAAPAAGNDNQRFHIVVSSEGERGSVLFLIDTRDGATWIYRPPIGPAINGYWSDIPRLTYPPELWQRAIQMLMQPPAAASNAAPTGTTPPPAK